MPSRTGAVQPLPARRSVGPSPLPLALRASDRKRGPCGNRLRTALTGRGCSREPADQHRSHKTFPYRDGGRSARPKRTAMPMCVTVPGRYGSVDDVEQLSYTEMEFDYAVKTKKPVMGFLHGNPGKLPGDKLDFDQELREKLDAFRGKIEKKMVKYWNEPGDLPGQVALAIMQIRKSHPAVGWIRASEAMTPAVKAELAELRAKVRELSADLHDEQRQNASAVDPSDLVQGDETAPLDCTFEFHWQWRIDAGDAYQHNRARARWTVNPTWNDVLKHLGPELMDETSEEYLRERLSALCDGLARDDLIKDDDNDDDDTDAETDADETSGDDEADEPSKTTVSGGSTTSRSPSRASTT
jgi:hypothetical protein